MDQLQYLIATTLSGSNRDDLAFSALPDAPIVPIRLGVIDRLRLLVKAVLSLRSGVADSRGLHELGETVPIDGTAATL